MPRALPQSLGEFVRGWPIRRLECGCLKWIGGCSGNYKDGRLYGVLKIAGRHYYAHRLANELVHGPIRKGMLLNRRTEVCDEPMCVLPEHWARTTRAAVPKNNARRKLTRRGVAQAIPVMLGRRRKESKLSLVKARAIRARRGESADALAAEYGIDRSMVYGIWSGRYWPEALHVAARRAA